MPEINDRVKEVRKLLGINQKQMAQKIGIRQSYYSDVENGKRNVSKRIIDGLISEFSVSNDWVFSGKGTPFSNKEVNKNVSVASQSKNKVIKHTKELDLIPAYLELDSRQLSIMLSDEIQEIMNLFDTRIKLLEICKGLQKENYNLSVFEENFHEFATEWEALLIQIHGSKDENGEDFFKILKLVWQVPAMKSSLLTTTKIIVNQIYRDFFNANP